MAIEFKKTTYPGRQPAIWRGEAKVLPGGFAPAQTFANGTTILRGTPLAVDFSTMSANVCKTAKVLTGSTTTKIRVSKDHLFTVGDVVMKIGKTDVSPSITAIDTTNADYDVLTVAAISGLAADDVIAEATPKDGETPAAPKYLPNAVVAADVDFNGRGLPTLDAAYEAVVLSANLPNPVLDEWLEGGMVLKNNHSIKFIKQ